MGIGFNDGKRTGRVWGRAIGGKRLKRTKQKERKKYSRPSPLEGAIPRQKKAPGSRGFWGNPPLGHKGEK